MATRKARELEALRRRLDLVIARLGGISPPTIARTHHTTTKTVNKWLARFAARGVAGLLSESSPGRPPEVHPLIRKELVRLPQESRPPLDLGDQWTTRSLGKAFGLSHTAVANVWKDVGYDPPQHLQQVEHSPDRRVPLRLTEHVPAWLKLHLELLCREQDTTLEAHMLDALTGWAGADEVDDMRAGVVASLRDRWIKANEQLPREDPRQPEYRLALRRRRDDGR